MAWAGRVHARVPKLKQRLLCNYPSRVDNPRSSMTPELRHLRYFVAVAEELNYTRAAEILHLSPQALSATIQQLESALGLRLLERTTRRVELTDAGAAFLPGVRRTLRQAELAVQSAERAARGETGTVRIGFLSSTAHYVMPPVVRALDERYPDIDLRTEDMAVGPLVDAVRDGHLDAGVTRPLLIEDAALSSESILSEPVAAVLPAGHRLARRGNSVQSLLALVAAGVGVTRLTLSARTLRDSGVSFVSLKGETAEVVFLTR